MRISGRKLIFMYALFTEAFSNYDDMAYADSNEVLVTSFNVFIVLNYCQPVVI